MPRGSRNKHKKVKYKATKAKGQAVSPVTGVTKTDNFPDKRPSKRQRQRAFELIDGFGSELLREKRKTLAKNNVWRIDAQGMFEVNGSTFYNVQLQLNAIRKDAKHRTTYAIIHIPVLDVPISDGAIRDALKKSFAEEKVEILQL